MDYSASYSGTFDDGMAATILGLLGTYLLVVVVLAVVILIANWRIYTKAGEEGWKSIIPIYSDFVAFKLFWKPMFFWVAVGCSICTAVLNAVGSTMDAHSGGAAAIVVISAVLSLAAAVLAIIKMHKMSVCFGHGVGFTLGLIFLNPIFLMILAFGSSQYLGNKDAE